ncbi:MAG: hypothetical protein QOI95_479 [Acidimicrobiaceae bacterium]
MGPAPADVSRPAAIIDPEVFRADPFLMSDPVAHKYRMFTTQDVSGHVPMWVADDVLGPWTFAGEALPVPPQWASDDFRLWAPEVANIDGLWTLWGSAGVKDTPAVCLYRAIGPSPAGPFVVDSGPPKLCDVSDGGAIDPHMVRDDTGAWWLAFKPNRNVYARRTRIDVVRLDPHGLPTGAVISLIEADEPWMHDLMESPSFVMDPVAKRWWLVFSAGYFSGDATNYRIAAVPCAGPGGPCSSQEIVTLVASNDQGTGPGEQSLFTDVDGSIWMAYNPIAPFIPSGRPLALVRLAFDEAGLPYAARPNQ